MICQVFFQKSVEIGAYGTVFVEKMKGICRFIKFLLEKT